MKKITKEQIVERIIQKFGNEYEIIGETFGMEKNAKFKHLKCGRVWEQTPYNFLNGIGCIECNKSEQYNKLSFQDVKNKIEKKYGT